MRNNFDALEYFAEQVNTCQLDKFSAQMLSNSANYRIGVLSLIFNPSECAIITVVMHIPFRGVDWRDRRVCVFTKRKILSVKNLLL
mmetsp:Transcript_65697/g.115900  ORF Transcript_65697/g.115900 Transcript_65697/m.115900 type:complete len:86 (+) Transcript_65697:922-1179(+)